MKIAIPMLAGLSLLLTSFRSYAQDETVPTTLSADIAEAVSIFDGETLAGWYVKGDSRAKDQWSVVDGCIVTENDGGSGSDLWTEKDYENYELNLKFQTLSDYYDTGVFIRSGKHQVQIGISGSLKRDLTACIYAPSDGQGKYPAVTDKIARVNQIGQWNDLRIVVKGNRIQTFLNGEAMVDYQCVKISDNGPIGLQLHPGCNMKVRFKEIQLQQF